MTMHGGNILNLHKSKMATNLKIVHIDLAISLLLVDIFGYFKRLRYTSQQGQLTCLKLCKLALSYFVLIQYGCKFQDNLYDFSHKFDWI